ncbi:hypothetical protein UFOVP1636_103 [uncultured Caudovirales phage]|uniref:Uncharacterized protein n=1 Tax=uncultured Caudovirales phage TaxID=2100421 RepID=A0A6J5T0I1_9CAUD|nr:hypothetical protein UFOVP1636_103 [uncultured Caudovirales phage]
MKKQTIYLVAYYYIRPKSKSVRTQDKGWMKEQNAVQYDEQVAVVRNLKTSDKTTAKIILDLGNKIVVRNAWEPDSNFDTMFAYFMSGYPKYTKDIMDQLDPEYMTRFLSKPSDVTHVVDIGADEILVETPAIENAEISAVISGSISTNEHYEPAA